MISGGKWLRLPQPAKGRCIQSVLREESGNWEAEYGGGCEMGWIRVRLTCDTGVHELYLRSSSGSSMLNFA